MTSEPHRLHPAAIAVLALKALRDAAVPIVIVLLARGLDVGALERNAFYLVLGVAIATLTGFMRWRSTSYAVDERGVHYKSGIISTKATTVPLNRIQGLDTVAAVLEAGRIRLRPILMTSVATIMGAVPVAWGFGAGSAARRPLGYAIVGGVFFSTALTLFVVPAAYVLLDRLRAREARDLQGRALEPAEAK